MRKKVFAHRGSSGTHPENTLIAIKDAIEARVDGIEIDVQKTKDGRLVVIHDELVDRTTNGMGYIKDMLFEDVRQLDAGILFSQAFKHERIPELHEVLELLEGTSIEINIELKNNLIDYPGLEEDVYQVIKNMNMMEQTIISSFNHDSLERFSKLAPEAELAILTEEPLQNPKEYLRKIGAKSIHCNLEAYQDMIKTMEAKEIVYRVFTLNASEDFQRWVDEAGYDIFTDYPRQALAVQANTRLVDANKN